MKEVWPDGTIFQGDYEEGLMHGKGLLIYKDNCMYDGNFVEGQMTGKGVYVWTGGKHPSNLQITPAATRVSGKTAS